MFSAAVAFGARVAMASVALASLMILSPLLFGKRDPAKYLVAFGFVIACCGASAILHGGWDWFRTR